MKDEQFQFEGVDLLSFLQRFPDEVQCKAYLSYYKWKDGFKCSKCGGTEWWKGVKPFTRTCKACRHIESATSNTLFHKVKFGLRKAFIMVYEITTTTKSISSAALARKLSIQKDTSWLFMQKVRQSMKGEGRECPLDMSAKTLTMKALPPKQKQKKKKRPRRIRFWAAIRKAGYGIGHTMAIKGDQVRIAVDEEVKIPLPDENKKEAKQLQKLMNRFSDGLLSWIRGIHHHVSEKHCQAYLDEYCYRHNHHRERHQLFHQTVERMLAHPPWFYHKT